jgi:RNA polymerase sigma-70 factor (ECF subfamily)
MNEQELIQLTRQGNIEAFNELVLYYQERIYNQAYYILGDAVMTEDMTQEAFLVAYRKLDSFRGGSFKAWMISIVTNLCLDELRRRKRHPSIPLGTYTSDGEEIETPRWLLDPGESPETATEQAEFWHLIMQCLANLPQVFRIAVILVDIQGMNYSEAANVLNISLGTVKSRLARGRQKMACAYQEQSWKQQAAVV